MKKKKIEIVSWYDLKVGDFVEGGSYQFFCFTKNGGVPACLGSLGKSFKSHPISYVGGGVFEYTRFKPTKAFIKMCKRLLNLNYKEHHLDNLSYIEALAALKKYD